MYQSKTNPTQGDCHGRTSVNIGRRWMRQPQDVWLRRILFQIHLWAGSLIGLYVVVICLSGSVLLYRNELYRTVSPKPTIVAGTGSTISLDQLKSEARRAYPQFEVTDVRAGET